MTDQTTLEDIEDDDDLDDDDYIDDEETELMTDDSWEDHPGFIELKAKMPRGWHIVKIINYTYAMIQEIDQWLKDECRAKYKRVGFSSGCSTKVAVQFEDLVDATMFKLRWRG